MFRSLLPVTIFALLLNGCGVRVESNGERNGLLPAGEKEKPKEAMILPPSGLEDALANLTGPARKSFEYGKVSYPARAASKAPGNSELISSPNIPNADQQDLEFRAGGRPANLHLHGEHVAHGFEVLTDNRSLTIVPNPSFRDSVAFKPLIENVSGHYPGVLLPHALSVLKEKKQLVLPLVMRSANNMLRANSACVAKTDGQCLRNLDGSLSDKLTASGKLVNFVPVLTFDAVAMKLADGEEIKITFLDIEIAHSEVPLTGEACRAIPIDNLGWQSPVSHPGKNPHVNEFLNASLELFIGKNLGKAETRIAEFVSRIQIADCKLTAVSEIQVHRDKCPLKKAHQFLVAQGSTVTSGASVVPSGPIDITTINHVWNAFSNSGDEINAAEFTMWDRTRRDSPILDYVFTAELTSALLAKFALVAPADFSLAGILSPVKADEIAVPADDTKLREAAEVVVASLKAQVAKSGDESPLVTIRYSPTYSVARKGELLGSVELKDLDHTSLDRKKLRSLGSKNTERRFMAVVTHARQMRTGYDYPANYHKGADAYKTAEKMAAFLRLDRAAIMEDVKRKESGTPSWGLHFMSDGDLNAGNAGGSSIFPKDKITSHHIARYWRAEGVKGIRPKFEILLEIFVYPE